MVTTIKKRDLSTREILTSPDLKNRKENQWNKNKYKSSYKKAIIRDIYTDKKWLVYLICDDSGRSQTSTAKSASHFYLYSCQSWQKQVNLGLSEKLLTLVRSDCSPMDVSCGTEPYFRFWSISSSCGGNFSLLIAKEISCNDLIINSLAMNHEWKMLHIRKDIRIYLWISFIQP